ncbi:MAG TPA: hypothetical protein VHM02_15890 [Thermoanaerobaculia bacterium]|nr:hypothetical protein [Thermoanaerobaculia bacterium]
MTRPPVRPAAGLAAACLLALAAACASAPAGEGGAEENGGRDGGRDVERIYTLRISFPDGTERVDVGEGETVRLVREDAIYEFVPRLSHDKRGHLELTARRTHLNVTQEGVLIKPMHEPTGIDFSTSGIDVSQELGGSWPSVGVRVLRVRPPVMPGSWMPTH